MGNVTLLNFLAGALAFPISFLLIIRFLNKAPRVINLSLYYLKARGIDEGAEMFSFLSSLR